jgi:hypothetical protein
MVQQWKKILSIQIEEQMYDDENKEYFMNMLIHKNANFTNNRNTNTKSSMVVLAPKDFLV